MEFCEQCCFELDRCCPDCEEWYCSDCDGPRCPNKDVCMCPPDRGHDYDGIAEGYDAAEHEFE